MTNRPSDLDVFCYAALSGRHPSQLLSPDTVREIECPECHAKPGFACLGITLRKETNHRRRYIERIRLLMIDDERLVG
jgi:hypothetical protein